MRSKSISHPAGLRQSPLSSVAIIFLLTMVLGSTSVLADHPIADPYTGLCPADTVGAPINCTADDVQIALVTAEDEETKCIHGETAVLNLNTEIEINAASERDDAAAWLPTFTEIGKNMLLPSAQGGPASCQSKGFHEPIYADGMPETPENLVVDDLDGDSCGDVTGINQTFTRPFTAAEVACDGTVGGAAVDAVVSWHLSGNDPVCNTHQDYGNFKKSKCSNTRSFVDLIVVGKLTVCKVAVAGTDIDFQFDILDGPVWVDGTGGDETPTDAPNPFFLNPISGLDCMTFNVPTQQDGDGEEVTIAEDVPEDWSVADISCINNADNGNPASFTPFGDNGFTIGLTEGDLGDGGTNPGQPDVTCTFTNVQGGSITIIKDAEPNSDQAFSFSGDLGVFELDDDGNGVLPNQITFDMLDAGIYNVIEGGEAGWDLTDISCQWDEGSGVTFGADNVTIDLGIGGEVFCTFTNTQRGMIRVQKETLPDGDPTSFTFSGDLAGVIGDGGFLEAEVIPGAYSTTETVPAGWDLATVTCDDGDSVGDVGTATATYAVDPGEVVTCFFTNVLQGTIVVEKAAIGGDDTFDFTRSWGAGFQIATTGGSGSQAFNNLAASDEVLEDTYAVNEDTSGLEAARWNFDGVVCTGDQGAEDNNAIDLDPGETVTCVFTNTKWSSITVVKESPGFSDEFCFDITPPVDDPFVECIVTVDGAGENGEDNAELGLWSIVEIVDGQNLWILADAACDNGDDPAALNLGPGEDVVCTFLNIIPTPVPVNSPWALLALLLIVLGTAWHLRPAAMRRA